jgi:hypothetical protein
MAGAVFIDSDDHDAPDDAPLVLRIQAACSALKPILRTPRGNHLIVACPSDRANMTSFEQLAESAELVFWS